MRTTAFIAAIFVLASFLSGSVDNAATAVAFANPEPPARFLAYRAIDRLQSYGMKKRALYKRTPQRGGKSDDENDDENRGKNGGRDADRNADRNADRGADRNADRDRNRGEDRNENGKGRDDDRQNNNGKERDDGGKAKNDEDDERNAKNNQDAAEETTSSDDEEEDENPNADLATDNTAANETSGSGASAEGDSDLYNSAPSSVNTKGTNNGTVIAAVAVSALLLVGASAIVFMRRKKHVEQTEAIIEKSASAFVQQNSAYEALDDPPLPIGTYTVMTRFTPNLEDELDVDIGDMIAVLVEYDDGWVQGVNESRGGQKGVMPRHCLNMTSKYAISKRSSSIGGFTSVNL